MLRRFGMMCVFASIAALPATAQDVRITQDFAERSITLNGTDILIQRIQDTDHMLEGEFSRTSRVCPPFCITPFSAAPGVSTIGELEVIDFLETRVASGDALLLDSRLPEFFTTGSIPGGVNLPFATLAADNPYRDRNPDRARCPENRHQAGISQLGSWRLALFGNGPWCDQSPRAIRPSAGGRAIPLISLFYYRGGMQAWLQLGLNAQIPSGG
jgi:rhodanese-related sulfurtransferase